MANEVKRADVSALITTYNTIRTSVTFTHGAAGGTGTLTVNVANLNSPIPEKVTLTSLKAGIDDLFAKFSLNCNCKTNTDCNQTCQSSTCQNQCTPTGNQAQCNAQSNQGCQTTTCQTQCTTGNQSCQTPANQGCQAGLNQGCQANQANQANQTNQMQCSKPQCNCCS